MQPNVSEGVPFGVSTHADKGKYHVMKFVSPVRFQ